MIIFPEISETIHAMDFMLQKKDFHNRNTYFNNELQPITKLWTAKRLCNNSNNG